MARYIPLTFQLLLFDRGSRRSIDRESFSNRLCWIKIYRFYLSIYMYVCISLDFSEVYFYWKKKFYHRRDRRRVFIRKFQLKPLICITGLMGL